MDIWPPIRRGLKIFGAEVRSIVALPKRGQALSINDVEKALRRAAWFFLSLFPLLHRCFSSTHDCRKYCLADMVGRANAPDVLWPKGALRRQTQRINFAHGDFVVSAGRSLRAGTAMK